jgi:hypothetical protein
MFLIGPKEASLSVSVLVRTFYRGLEPKLVEVASAAALYDPDRSGEPSDGLCFAVGHDGVLELRDSSRGGSRMMDGQEDANYDKAIGQGSMIFRPNGTLEYLAVKGNTLYRIKHTPARTQVQPH